MRKLIVTFFGSGMVPVAPGTAGSVAVSVLLYTVFYFAHPTWQQWQMLLAFALLIACVLAVALGRWAVEYFGRKDPQAFVLDEVAGILLTNLLLPWTNPLLTIPLALVAFRIFDVTKIPPAKQLEKLPAGWGILLDDLAAGVYANVLCQVLLRL